MKRRVMLMVMVMLMAAKTLWQIAAENLMPRASSLPRPVPTPHAETWPATFMPPFLARCQTRPAKLVLWVMRAWRGDAQGGS
jgi:hypothetical protein